MRIVPGRSRLSATFAAAAWITAFGAWSGSSPTAAILNLRVGG